jgi:SSS family solute:Na+ symporter
MAGIIAMSLYLGRRQHSPDDYFLAGRRMENWPIALSIMATQVSAVSLIGAPAFVALKPGGGLRWLQYELAVPLAMIALILVFVPRLRSLPITTLYDYLEMRFGARARSALSLVFLISRGLSTAVALYAASMVLSVCLELSLVWTMMVLASITILYTTIGGIEADIYSDIVQMFVVAGGTVIALAVAVLRVGTTGA